MDVKCSFTICLPISVGHRLYHIGQTQVALLRLCAVKVGSIGPKKIMSNCSSRQICSNNQLEEDGWKLYCSCVLVLVIRQGTGMWAEELAYVNSTSNKKPARFSHSRIHLWKGLKMKDAKERNQEVYSSTFWYSVTQRVESCVFWWRLERPCRGLQTKTHTAPSKVKE